VRDERGDDPAEAERWWIEPGDLEPGDLEPGDLEPSPDIPAPAADSTGDTPTTAPASGPAPPPWLASRLARPKTPEIPAAAASAPAPQPVAAPPAEPKPVEPAVALPQPVATQVLASTADDGDLVSDADDASDADDIDDSRAPVITAPAASSGMARPVTSIADIGRRPLAPADATTSATTTTAATGPERRAPTEDASTAQPSALWRLVEEDAQAATTPSAPTSQRSRRAMLMLLVALVVVAISALSLLTFWDFP
jgi:hypothetical protein